MQDLHRVDPTIVEYFRNIVASLRYGDAPQEELAELDQVVRTEVKEVQC